MVPPTRSVDWRDEAAADLLLRHLPELSLPAPALVMGDPGPDLVAGLSILGVEAEVWNRRAVGGIRATPWPPEGPFGTAALRLPRSKEELEMSLHGAAGCLGPGGTVLVYGAKDEGIGSASKRMQLLFDQVTTVAVGGHCRILRGRRRSSLSGHRGSLSAWREEGRLVYREVDRPWISYPGVFAHGRLDPGTRLLLDHLPDGNPGMRILDFGCGSGVVGAVAASRYPQVRLELLDIDAVSLEAARENVPEGRMLLADGLPRDLDEPYDLLLSNPPFHRGKGEEPGMIHGLIQEAPRVLAGDGRLVLVAQRRLTLDGVFRRFFGRVAVRADAGGFRVWQGEGPTWKPEGWN